MEQSLNIQWYPGHMTKTRRQMEEQIKKVDAVCELLDARIPQSSRNPDLAVLCGAKPRLVILNRCDLADALETERWAAFFQKEGASVLLTDAKTGKGTNAFAPAVRALLKDKLKAYEEKGQVGRVLRLMVAGIPNVGKSTFINRIAGRRAAKAENRPGVTRAGQWVPLGNGLELLDTPGILWPKFEDETVGLHLAFTGAVKDSVLDIETLGCCLAALLASRYPDAMKATYRLKEIPAREEGEGEIAWGLRILEDCGRKRGCLVSGGEIDTERASKILIDEFRAGKLGRITLEAAP